METEDNHEPKNVATMTAAPPQPHGNRIREEHVVAAATESDCPSCAAASDSNGGDEASFVYALGRIEARFPNLSLEKEYAQIVKAGNTQNLTDPETMHKVLTDRGNRYIVRQLCWVFSVEGIDTFILQPRDGVEFEPLVAALRPAPQPYSDIDVVIGVKGPIAPPDMCNGLSLPVVFFDQIYSFDIDSLLKSIPKPEKIAADRFAAASSELFGRIMQMVDNAGATDEHRALNYLAVREQRIYHQASLQYANNFTLSSVETNASRLSGQRRILQVIFNFTNRETQMPERFFTRVDVTEEFPFLVSPLQPYYERV